MLFFLYAVLPSVVLAVAIIYAVLYNSKEDGLEIRAFWLRKHINHFYKNSSKGKCVQYTYALNEHEREEVMEDAINIFHNTLAESKFDAKKLKSCADIIARIKIYNQTEKGWKK